MPVINRMAELQGDIAAWRRDFHANPELLYDTHRTSAEVARMLREFGCDSVVEGIGRTGVVGVIRGKRPGDSVIGLRADMDALPIEEETGKDWSSTVKGKMHACGHDGHTAMLLGAARYLAETRNFSGSAVVIFQPAEEGGAGGKAMVDDGMMDRFGITEVYGLHNMPGLPVGHFAIRSGAIMAATDEFDIEIRGQGSHAAMPHLSVDPIAIGSQLVQAMQTVVSRNAGPIENLVVSVTQFHAGTAHNIIPETATLNGTVRSLRPETRALAEKRIRELAQGIAAAHGAKINIRYEKGYPVTFNHDHQTAKAVEVAREIAGDGNVNDNVPPVLGGEDFSYMLEARPGAFIFMGNGDTAGLHTPQYDFNDDAIPHGSSYWVRLVEKLLPA
jgi:amidohydrolase